MTTEGRELEERRARSEEPAVSRAIPAIYLIEREAIRLRRLRWCQLAAAVPPGAPAHESASPPAQSALLETYARPRSDADSAAVPRTFGGKIKRFFGFRDKRQP